MKGYNVIQLERKTAVGTRKHIRKKRLYQAVTFVISFVLVFIASGLANTRFAFADDEIIPPVEGKAYTDSAKTMDEVLGESVYASPSEQDAIYEIIENSEHFINMLKKDGIRVVKESITPIYQVNFLEYARTGIFEIKPVVAVEGRIDWTSDSTRSEPSNYFAAKMVTSEGWFAGDIWFYVENGVARVTCGLESKQFMSYLISIGELNLDLDMVLRSNSPTVSTVYYADHVEQISAFAGRVVPADEVRLVMVSNVATVFYINDGKTEGLVSTIPGLAPELREPIYYDIFGSYEPTGIVYVDEALKAIADAVLQEHIEYVAEWEALVTALKAKYGDDYWLYLPVGGGDLSSYFVGDDLFDASVIDLDSSTSDISDTNDINPGIIIGAVSASLLLAAAVSFFVLRSKKRSRTM